MDRGPAAARPLRRDRDRLLVLSRRVAAAAALVAIASGALVAGLVGVDDEQRGPWRTGTVIDVSGGHTVHVPRWKDFDQREYGAGGVTKTKYGGACIVVTYVVDLDDGGRTSGSRCARPVFSLRDVPPFPLGTASYAATFAAGDRVRVRSSNDVERVAQGHVLDEIAHPRARHALTPFIGSVAETMLLLTAITAAGWILRPALRSSRNH